MADERSEYMARRLEKAARLRQRGIDPYPPRSSRTHNAADALAAFQATEERGGDPAAVIVAGRITAQRTMGKAAFLDLRDGAGQLQAYVKQDTVGAAAFTLLDDLDLGDFIEVEGPLFRTRTNEPTIGATRITVLAKALRPPPEKWHGLSNVEIRYRQRYLDLMANEEVREAFRLRSRIIAAIRRFMDGEGFIEVETPVLQPSAGGAAARPFFTHHNALDREFALRISLELHLKRLLVGGFDRVYEIGRIFRNEGVSTRHNPEFTLMESYEAYADYRRVAEMVERMVANVAQEVLGSTRVQFGDDEIDFTPPWRRLTLREALIEHTGVDFEQYRDGDALRVKVEDLGVRIEPGMGWGKMLDELFSERVQPHLIQPTFLMDYPLELSPLAKQNPDDPSLVERFEPFAAGMELGNAYTELNDPEEQRRRFEEQLRLRAAGDEEAELMDEDFLVALEHGMPPAGGLGIGIDRLVMILTGNRSIREVILFPQLRSES